MLTVLWRIERWLSENEDCFLGIASHVVENTPMPKLFHQVPVPHNTALNRIDDAMSAVHVSCLLSDREIKSFGDLFVADGPSSFGALIP